MWQRFTKSSTVHGLKYLGPPNGHLVKLIWSLAISATFVICCFMINEHIQEERSDPISSNIRSRPISTFPFPTITISLESPISINLHPLQSIAPVLNYLTFDCLNNKVLESKDCERKSTKVRNHFKDLLSETLNIIYVTLQNNLFFLSNLHEEANKMLCENFKYSRSVIFRFLMSVILNNTSSVKGELPSLFGEIFVMPMDTIVEELERKMKTLQEYYGNVQDCSQFVGNTTKEMLSLTLPFLLATSRDEKGSGMLQLGTLLTLAHHDMAMSGIVEHAYLQSLVGTVEDILMGGNKEKEFSPLQMKSLQLLPTTNSLKLQKWHYKTAVAVANKFGLDEDVLLPMEMNTNVPIVWACFNGQKMLKECFDVKLSFTSTGVGLSLNMPKWRNIFRSGSFPINEVLDAEGNTTLSGSDEVTLYVRSPTVPNYGSTT